MPKKTKKEKILAEYRRKLKYLEKNAVVRTNFDKKNQSQFEHIGQGKSNVNNDDLVKEQKQSITKSLNSNQNFYDTNLLRNVKSDLKKTFLISLLILGLELVFYNFIFK